MHFLDRSSRSIAAAAFFGLTLVCFEGSVSAQESAAPAEQSEPTVTAEEVVRAYNRRRPEEALELSTRRIAQLEAAGEGEELVSARSSHGAILLALERYDDARAELLRAAQAGEDLLGSTSPTTLNARYNYAMTFYNEGDFTAALPLLEAAYQEWLDLLGRNDLLDMQLYEPGAITRMNSLADALAKTGQGERAMRLVADDITAVNISLNDLDARTNYLQILLEVHEEQGRAADLANDDLDSFVQRTSGISAGSGYDLFEQRDVQRRVYEAAGLTDKALEAAYQDPDYVEDRFEDLLEESPEAALAFLDGAIEWHDAQCGEFCYAEDIFGQILRAKSDYLIDEGREAEAVPALRRFVEISRYSRKISDREKERVQEQLAAALEGSGQAGEALAVDLRIEGVEADPDLDGNTELTIARKLRAAGHEAEADAIVAEQMECIFPDGETELKYHTPCSSGWAAMSEYAAILERDGKRKEAAYYRLPLDVVKDWKAREDEQAQAHAGELVDAALDLWEPTDYRMTLALKIFRGQHRWDEIPLYDIPERWRICGRWDEPAPPRPEPTITTSSGDTVPMPRLVPSVAAPGSTSERRYLPLGYGHVTAADPRGKYYHSLNNVAGMSLDQYARQCASLGKLEDAVRFSDWALGLAAEMGYPVEDQEELWLQKAKFEQALRRYDDAERSMLAVVDPVLAGTAKSGDVFNPNKAVIQLVEFYGQMGRGERLLTLLTRMSESGQFGEGYGSSQASRPLREMLYLMFVGTQDFERAEDVLATLSPWEKIVDAEMNGTEGRALDELKAREFTAHAMRFVELEKMRGNLDAALQILDQAQELNEEFFTKYPPNPDVDPYMARFLLNGQLHAQRGGVLAQQGKDAEALSELEKSGIFQFSQVLIDGIAEDIGEQPTAETFAALMNSDREGRSLIASFRASYATGAELAMRSGDEAKAIEYFNKFSIFPSSNEWSLYEQQSRWVGVSLGIARQEWRERGLADASALVEGLERQWALASRNSLDSSFLKEMLMMAPAYFGDVLTLRSRARDEGLAEVDEAAAFRHLQWSIMSVTDLSIAQSAARNIIGQDDPAIERLLTERDQISRTLYSKDNVSMQSAPTYDYGPREQTFARNAQRLRDIDDEIRDKYPDYFEITSSEPVELDRARESLESDEALLLVSPGRFATHIMLLTSEGLVWKQSELTLDDTARHVRNLRYFLRAMSDDEFNALEDEAYRAIVAREREVDGAWQGYDRETAQLLYREFVAPFAEQLSGKSKLIVSPGGPLSGLPFAALVSEIAEGRDDDANSLRNTRYLVDDFAITQIPALQSFILLREQGDGRKPGKVRFMGFGDPDLEGEAIIRGARGERGTAGSPAEVDELWGGNGIDLARLKAMNRLPGTKAELESMQAAFGAGAEAVMLSTAATETNVKQADLSKVDVLAFATHGVMAGELPGASEPGLVFTPPPEASEMDDGYLTASEVSRLDLAADWVILSACNTASADGSLGAPALSGLAKSFFHAGAKSLLVSHWYIRDDVASEITVAAITAQQENPGWSRAEGLRAAMLAIRSNTDFDTKLVNEFGDEIENSWAHPSAWAPLTVISGN